MNGFLNKNLKSYAKNWLVPVKYAEMQSKNAVRNQYTNLYAYAANNPVHYIDPDGNYTDEWINSMPSSARNYIKYMEPNRFSQKLWTTDKRFKSYKDKKGKTKYFWQTACYATSILNIVSAIYQKETGNILTEEQAIGALKAAIKAEYIDSKDATIIDITKAANAMAKFLKMKGTFRCNEKSPEYMIYAIDKTTYKHFVNALENEIGSQYFDVWDGKIKSYSETIINEDGKEVTQNLINLQEGRQIRGLDYN